MTTAAFAAAVLAGGHSRRMGHDKALIEVGGKTMVERVVERARTAGADPVAIVGHRRPELLPAAVAGLVIGDEQPGTGPLGGLLTAVSWTPCQVVLVLACDLPDLDPADLARLAGAVQGARLVAVLTGPRGREPLVAAWHRATTADLRQALQSGARAMHEVLDGLGAAVAEVPVADTASLRNVNRPQDLAVDRSEQVTPSPSPARRAGGLG